MNTNQLRHIESFHTTLDYLEKNRAIWDGIKTISDHIADVRDMTQLLNDKMRRQTAPTNGSVQEAQGVRQELEAAILRLATQGTLFALKTGDRQLAAECAVAPSILGLLSREALEWTGDRLHESISQRLVALKEFGVTEADINGLQSLLQRFQDAKTAPRQAIAERSRETTTLPELVRAIARMFRQLDRLMTRFRPSNPEFFAGYLTVRVIVNRGTRRTKAPATPGPVAEPKVEPTSVPGAGVTGG